MSASRSSSSSSASLQGISRLSGPSSVGIALALPEKERREAAAEVRFLFSFFLVSAPRREVGAGVAEVVIVRATEAVVAGVTRPAQAAALVAIGSTYRRQTNRHDLFEFVWGINPKGWATRHDLFAHA